MKTRSTLSRLLCAALFLVASVAGSAADAVRHPISVDDLLKMQRVADVQISPDGAWVSYTVATPSVENNVVDSNLWIASTMRTDVRQLTRTGKDRSARWAPDGKRIAFLSRRDGKSQAYVLAIDGGEAAPAAKLTGDIDTLRWSPDNATLIVTAQTWPDCTDDACNRTNDEKRAKESTARVYGEWPFISAMAWLDAKRSHVFAVRADGSGAARDLTPRWPGNIPFSIAIDGSVDGADVAVSPDGKELSFVSGSALDATGQAVGQIWRVPLSGGEPQRLTKNSGSEKAPVYSPDGRFIAYRWNAKPANTGGQAHLMTVELATGAITDVTGTIDRGASSHAWTADGRTLLYLAEAGVNQPIYSLAARAGAKDTPVAMGFNGELSVATKSPAVAFARSSFSQPAEVFVMTRPGATPRQITHHNDAIVATLDLPAAETFQFPSKDGATVEALFLRPPATAASGKVPLLVLLHGGPHTTWNDAWNWRWNSQVFAAPGRAILIVNRRGSTAYGQKFSDGVIGDWGGAPYEDIMTGVDVALAKYPFLDSSRVAAAGASYGGYMADWLATHTNRFKTIVSHAGVWDFNSEYGGDIPWFLEFEMQGQPWATENFRKWSPSTYAAALGQFKTPMLITAGEKDYRVPYQQSLALFTSLQRQGIPSKLIVFPEAGHWIAKPKDALLWYSAINEWLAKYLDR
jgi:dipeptidyl aminopeptidase/acylaminoacyl peptidase